LRALEERSVSMSEIAKRYYVTQATVTSTVDKLERMGLVKRNREEFDRRIVTVNLTEEGRMILKDLSKIVYDFMDKAVEGVDYESVIPVLEKVLKNVESMEKRG
jgi:DNA-binding MarR family transcriptional regulator